MAEEQTQSIEDPQEQAQAEPADATDWKAEARKWEARAKENKAKAEAYDEAQEAAKSDLQKASEQAEKWKAKYEGLVAEKERMDAVSRAAREYGVDAETLKRMSGDVDENAQFLKKQAEAAPKYPSVYDGGQQSAPVAQSTAQQFASAVEKMF